MPIDTAELMKQVGKIRVITNRLVDEHLSGEYHSVFKGQGIEFDEVREYTAGDDVRSIDWNVTARMGHPFVKRFAEERELTVIFLIDISGSQGFGSDAMTKAETAAGTAALLALSAIKNQDKIGLILFSDRILKCIPPRKGKTAVMRIVREVLASDETRHGTDITSALRFLNNVQKRKSVVFLLSDFRDKNYAKELKVTARKHDVICCPITDPRELELPDVGLIELQDPETGETMILDSSSAQVRKTFQKKAIDEQELLLSNIKKMKSDCIFLSTDRPFVDDVRKFFKQRQFRRR